MDSSAYVHCMWNIEEYCHKIVNRSSLILGVKVSSELQVVLLGLPGPYIYIYIQGISADAFVQSDL